MPMFCLFVVVVVFNIMAHLKKQMNNPNLDQRYLDLVDTIQTTCPYFSEQLSEKEKANCILFYLFALKYQNTA